MTSRRRKILLGCVIILAALFAITSPLLIEGWRQQKLLNLAYSQYTAALIKGDLDRAYALCSPGLQRSISVNDFRDQHASLEKRLGKIEAAEQGQSVAHGYGSSWDAEIHAKLIHSKGTSRFLFKFIGDGTNWRLNAYQEQ